MQKKCIICEENQAVYKIKDTSDYYCLDCAKENFADLKMLLSVEEEVNRLGEAIKERYNAELAKQNEQSDQTRTDSNF